MSNIWLAAGEGNLDAVKQFIDQGVSPNAKDDNAYTPLHAAASWGHSDILRYLVEKGGDINLEDDDGDTPLYVVEQVGMARLVVELGGDPKHTNSEGLTPAAALQEEYPHISLYLRTLTGESGPATLSASSSGDAPAPQTEEQLGDATDSLMAAVRGIMERSERGELSEQETDAMLREVVEQAVTGQVEAGRAIGEQMAVDEAEQGQPSRTRTADSGSGASLAPTLVDSRGAASLSPTSSAPPTSAPPLSPLKSTFRAALKVLTPTSTAPSRRPSQATLTSQHTSATLDSIWDVDFSGHWEWRQREDARRLAELKGSVPYLTFGQYQDEVEAFRAQDHQVRKRRQGERDEVRFAPTRTTTRTSGPGAAGGRAEDLGSSASSMGWEEAIMSSRPEDLWEEKEDKPKHWLVEWMDDNRRELRRLMRLKRLHLIIIGLVAFDLVIVIVELIVALLTAGCMTEEVYEYVLHAVESSHGHLKPAAFACTMAPTAGREALENAIFGINISLLSVFMAEVLASIYAFGPITYCTSWVSLLDGFVVVTTLCLDVYFHLSKDPAAKSPVAVVILRLWKIFRAIHAIGHALQLHYAEQMELAEQGRKKLEWERVTESIRLNFVRNALIRATGSDVDPVLIEDEVQRERAALSKQRKRDEERVYLELRQGSLWRSRSRHGGVQPQLNV
ncbi:hypothetical protein JCM10207_008051 [Rhodosporidiobolus poonsookiae]